MLDAVVQAAIVRRRLVLAVVAIVVLLGLRGVARLPIEAYPDVADLTVQVISQWPGHAAEEVERQVTLAVESEMGGVPRARHVRSASIFGLSVVTVVFDDGADPYLARQQIDERLRRVDLPNGVKPTLGPLAAPIGEIYRYTLRGPLPLAELKAAEEWTVERELRRVPGVADVVSFGGPTKQYEVRLRPEALVAHGITIADVGEALARSNRNSGGGFIEIGSQIVNVRGLGLIDSPDELRNIAIKSEAKGSAVRVRDVAEVAVGYAPRLGVVGRDRDDDVVQATVLMRRGENPTEVLAAVRARVADLNASGRLPRGVEVVPYYDRSHLIGQTTRTVLTNVAEGAALVFFVLLVFLRDVRSAVIVALTIPIALLVAIIGLDFLNMPANLLSLGAIDFGMIVDGAVVVVENVFRRLSEKGRGTAASAVSEVARPTAYSAGLLVVAYLPVLALESVEGKLFRPMAVTAVLALVGLAAFALFVAPALADRFVRGRPHAATEDRWSAMYGRFVAFSLRRRRWVVAGLVLSGAASAFLGTRAGSEFLPHLDEGALWVRATLPRTISLTDARPIVTRIRTMLIDVPEVKAVTSQVGRPDDGTDPTGPDNAEFYVELQPRDTWRRELRGDSERLANDIEKRLQPSPGVRFGFSQPIADNVEEAMSGVKGQLAVKVYGTDLAKLEEITAQIEHLLRDIPGVQDLAVLRPLGQTDLVIEVDRSLAAQFGVDASAMEDVLEAGVAGRSVSQIVEGDRRFDLVVRLAEGARKGKDELERLLVAGRDGRLIPIGQVAHVAFAPGASRIAREDGSRFVALRFSVRDRDLGSAVAEAQAKAKAVTMPDGYRVVWSGEFESQRRANGRLAVIMPITLLAITLVVALALRGTRDALILVANVALTCPVGGVVALLATGTHFSVSAGVGFLALFGVSAQTGILVLSTAQALERDGMTVEESILTAARTRLRPVTMMALVATLGLLPAATSRAMGSDAQRPLAIVVSGGLVLGLALSLATLPALYCAVARRFPRRRSAAVSAIGVATLVVATLLPRLAPASEPDPSLGRALAALRSNMDLVASRRDVDAARASITGARLLPNPTLIVGGGTLVHGLASGGEQEGQIAVSQVLPLGGKLGARTRVAEALTSATEKTLESVTFALTRDVVEAHAELAASLARRDSRARALVDIDRLSRLVDERVAAGANPAYDGLRVRVERGTVESRLAEADADAAVALGALLAAIGTKVDPASVTPRPFVPDPEPLPVERGLAGSAVAKRSDLQALTEAARAADLREDLARREAVPSPELQIGYAPSFRIPTDQGYRNGGSMLAQISIPLPLFDRGQGTIGRAASEAEAARARASALERRIRIDVDRAAGEASARASAWRTFHEVSLANARSMRGIADNSYREGKIGIVELIDAYATVRDATEREFDLRLAAQRARLTLTRALGPAR